MTDVGDPLPEFELEDESGSTKRSREYIGKNLVVYFYPKDFTPGCTREADEFSEMHAEFKKAGISILGISPDDPESHKKFCGKQKIPYTLLADVEKKVARAFGVWGKKKFMGREYEGVLRSTFLVGRDGKIFEVFRNVKPAGHAAAVLEKFKTK